MKKATKKELAAKCQQFYNSELKDKHGDTIGEDRALELLSSVGFNDPDRIFALAVHLDLTLNEALNDLTENSRDSIEYGSQEYSVLTDKEAGEQAAQYIEDSLWAFNSNFLANQTGINQEVFKAIQSNGKCEDNNNAIRSCIDDIDDFIDSAISADGRGHFMSSYDGEEHELLVNEETYFIYRTN